MENICNRSPTEHLSNQNDYRRHRYNSLAGLWPHCISKSFPSSYKAHKVSCGARTGIRSQTSLEDADCEIFYCCTTFFFGTSLRKLGKRITCHFKGNFKLHSSSVRATTSWVTEGFLLTMLRQGRQKMMTNGVL